MAHARSGWPSQSARSPLKRTRSESPISSKRRIPSSYQPAIYSSVPNHIFYETAGPNSSCDSATPTSSNGDWVSRTEDLQLATPPGGGSPLYDGEGYGPDADVLEAEVHSQESMDSEPIGKNQPPPLPFSADAVASASYFFNQHDTTSSSLPTTPLTRDSPFVVPTPPIPSPHPPHHAPSLYANLAGSPVERSLSSDSVMSEPPADVRMQESPSPKKATGGWRLAMGYRADCEKCINRVPGHYSHIIH